MRKKELVEEFKRLRYPIGEITPNFEEFFLKLMNIFNEEFDSLKSRIEALEAFQSPEPPIPEG